MWKKKAERYLTMPSDYAAFHKLILEHVQIAASGTLERARSDVRPKGALECGGLT